MADEREEALRLAKEAGFIYGGPAEPDVGIFNDTWYTDSDSIIRLIALARQSQKTEVSNSAEWRRGMLEAAAFCDRHSQEEHFGSTWADMLREFADRVTSPSSVSAAVIPDGWQLVPKEPTREMASAAWDPIPVPWAASGSAEGTQRYLLGIYRAMLAAAPNPT